MGNSSHRSPTDERLPAPDGHPQQADGGSTAMLLWWREVAPESVAKDLEELKLAIEAFWRAWQSGSPEHATEVLHEISPHLSCEKNGRQSSFEEPLLTCSERSALPLSQWVADLAPSPLRVRQGLSPIEHEEALIRVRVQVGIALDRARVRVGFSRGHLQEVVVLVPLDEEGSAESLQVAAEIYLEAVVGDHFLDTWVGDVSVDRIARTRGLLMVQDAQSTAESFALAEAKGLVHAGARGLVDALPSSLLEGHQESEVWTALNVDAQEGAVQGDRRYASTCYPEALKAALGGLPFSSKRFTRGGEVFLWLSFRDESSSLEARMKRREGAEAFVVRFLNPDQGCLAGTGFGLSRDYLDLWLLADAALIRSLAMALTELVGPVELGFYDSEWAEERVTFFGSQDAIQEAL